MSREWLSGDREENVKRTRVFHKSNFYVPISTFFHTDIVRRRADLLQNCNSRISQPTGNSGGCWGIRMGEGCRRSILLATEASCMDLSKIMAD